MVMGTPRAIATAAARRAFGSRSGLGRELCAFEVDPPLIADAVEHLGRGIHAHLERACARQVGRISALRGRERKTSAVAVTLVLLYPRTRDSVLRAFHSRVPGADALRRHLVRQFELEFGGLGERARRALVADLSHLIETTASDPHKAVFIAGELIGRHHWPRAQRLLARALLRARTACARRCALHGLAHTLAQTDREPEQADRRFAFAAMERVASRHPLLRTYVRMIRDGHRCTQLL
jgi:hypothetical protein